MAEIAVARMALMIFFCSFAKSLGTVVRTSCQLSVDNFQAFSSSISVILTTSGYVRHADVAARRKDLCANLDLLCRLPALRPQIAVEEPCTRQFHPDTFQEILSPATAGFRMTAQILTTDY